jgi:gliding motility-associated protein GldM
MALPKEPRQKMINLMYLVLTALLALNVSSEILNAFKVVDKSLQNSSANLTAANTTLYASLTEKLADPKTAEKAKIWEPKAEQAKKMSDDFITYIDGLKAELKKASDLTMIDGKESFKEDNLDAATRLFDNQGKGKELEAKLAAYKKAMLDVDPEIRAKFEKTLPIDTDPPVGQDGVKKDFTTGYFHMTPTVAALTLLSKFQNNIKNAENQVVTFCHEQIGAVKIKFDKTGVLVGQSSNYIMPGQEMEITAGIGAYSSAAQPKISIGGTSPAVIDGKAVYKITANGAGPHTVPVTVTYLDQDGVSQTKTENVQYTVGTPGGAAIMLDKMNVFYIGVPNPITISSGSGWDKTQVSMSGGTMSGSNGSRVVTVSGGTAASITVNADGKSSKFDFRIKSIPDPIGMVGPSKGGRIQSNIFKAQDFLRADLQNFDFDAKFNVTSAVVYFAGAGFANTGSVQTATMNSGSFASIRSKIDLCKPGSTVTFDELKVVGPDGRQRTIPPVSFVLF